MRNMGQLAAARPARSSLAARMTAQLRRLSVQFTPNGKIQIGTIDDSL